MPRGDNLTKANRISDWGNSLLNKLPAISRRRRKRHADKKRRQQIHRELTQSLTPRRR
ncbi:MAG: hypothetical protein AAGF84_05425 [Planctomycetota bacterium]